MQAVGLVTNELFLFDGVEVEETLSEAVERTVTGTRLA